MFFYAEDWIFAPALVRAASIVAEGAIGEPLYLRGKESHNGSHSPYAQTVESCGGGSMIHLGVHPIGFFTHLLGVPQRITGVCSRGGTENLLHKQLEGEDWAIGVLEYPNGTRAVVEGNYVTFGGMDDVVEIYGTEGKLDVDITFGSPISVYSKNGYGYALEKAETTTGWTRPAVNEHFSLGYRDELGHFTSCLLHGKEQIAGTTVTDAYNVLKITTALYESHESGRTLNLDE